MYDKQDKFTQALEFYNRALRIYERDNQKTFCANILKKIGDIHKAQDNSNEALNFYNKALIIDG